MAELVNNMQSIKQPFKTQHGLSLMELVIVMGLVGVLSLFLAGIFRNAVSLFLNQNLEIQVIESANLLNKFLLENLRRAESVGDTITDGEDTFVTDETELILRLPALDGSGNPIVGVYDHFVFYQDAENPGDFRWRSIPHEGSTRSAFDHLAAEEITDLSIMYDTFFPAEANIVTVTYTLTKENLLGERSITRSTSINMRNQ